MKQTFCKQILHKST